MGKMEFALAQSTVHGLCRVDVDTAPEVIVERLREEGVVLIENVIAPEQLSVLRGELDPWFDMAQRGAGPFFGRATKRFGGLFAKARSTAELALHPLVLECMESILRGPDPKTPRCDAIELNLTQAIGIEPGEPPQFLHRDEELWPFPHEFEIMTNAMWAIDDFTIDNGATRLVPGSHHWPRDRQPLPGDVIPAVAKAGSVVLWLGGVLHGGGTNYTNVMRRGVVMSYRLGWLAPTEKLLLSIPPEVARKLPEKLQRLIGYQIHRRNLGWVEGQDPIHWLYGQVSHLAACNDNLAPMHEELLAAAQADPKAFAGYLA